MFGKLAYRNVKHQLSNYIIYFITVSLTVSMMFALSNLIFSEQLLNYARKMEELQGALIGIAVIVSLIVAFVLGYASSFMLKLRKREFGTYLTMGMKRSQILLMFTIENLIIGLIALICGILFGLVLYQGMIGIVARVLELNITLGSYSINGLLLTVILTVITFIISTVSSALYLRKVSIYELLYANKKVSAKIKHPILWVTITMLSLITVIVAIIGVNNALSDMFKSEDPGNVTTMLLFCYMGSLAVGIVFFHIGLSKSVMYLLLKNQTFKSRGANTFILRQLSGQLSTNAVLCGIIALLITATVICTNVCFSQKTISNYSLNYSFPFDITVNTTTVKNDAPYSMDDVLDKIEKQSHIKKKLSYEIYSSENGYLHSFTPWTGEKYNSLNDSFILESDFNKLITSLGYKKIVLNGQFLIISTKAYLSQCDFSNAVFSLGGNEYTFKEATDQYPHLATCYFLAVVPDTAKASLQPDEAMVSLDLENDKYDVQSLYDAFSYTITTEQGYMIEQNPVNMRAYYELEENSLTAILIVGELYMAIIFVFLATAILTMKLLAEVPEDQKRYELLYKLGSDCNVRKKILFRQTFIMFALPFFIPVLLSIPAAAICGKVVSWAGYHILTSQIYQNSTIIAIVLICIQMLYFFATYFTKKKNII